MHVCDSVVSEEFMNTLFALSLSLLAFVSSGMSKKPSRPPAELAEALVREIPAAAFDLSNQMEGFRRDFGKDIPDSAKAKFDAEVAELTSEAKHRERVKKRYEADFTPEELQALIELQTPAQRKAAQIGAQAIEILQKDPAAYQKKVEEFSKTALPATRQKLLEKLVDASPMRKGVAAGQSQVLSDIKEKSGSKVDLGKIQEQMANATYEIFRKSAVQSSAYMYREFSDDELKQLIRAMQSPLLERTHAIFPDARNDLLHEISGLGDRLRRGK
jgi:hypothetical protein